MSPTPPTPPPHLIVQAEHRLAGRVPNHRRGRVQIVGVSTSVVMIDRPIQSHRHRPVHLIVRLESKRSVLKV